MSFIPYTPAPSPSEESKGAANGIASLDSSGKVPGTQLPSYVDDVLEYAGTSAFPSEGETGKIYVALDTNKSYRWSGTTYVELSSYAEATQSASGLMSATDKAKLDGISAGAQVNPGNATQSAAGLMSSTDKTKLDGIAAGAQVNPGNASQSASGLMSATDKTKLDGIATGANKVVVSDSLSDPSTTNALSAAKGKELNDQITKHSSYLTDTDSGTAVNEIIYNGLIVCINFTSASKTWSEGDQLGVVPSGMRPVSRVITTGSTYGSNIGVQVKIATDGKVMYESQTGITGRISFLAMYMLY